MECLHHGDGRCGRMSEQCCGLLEGFGASFSDFKEFLFDLFPQSDGQEKMQDTQWRVFEFSGVAYYTRMEIFDFFKMGVLHPQERSILKGGDGKVK